MLRRHRWLRAFELGRLLQALACLRVVGDHLAGELLHVGIFCLLLRKFAGFDLECIRARDHFDEGGLIDIVSSGGCVGFRGRFCKCRRNAKEGQ